MYGGASTCAQLKRGYMLENVEVNIEVQHVKKQLGVGEGCHGTEFRLFG